MVVVFAASRHHRSSPESHQTLLCLRCSSVIPRANIFVSDVGESSAKSGPVLNAISDADTQWRSSVPWQARWTRPALCLNRLRASPHPSLCTLHSTPYTLHPIPYTLHPSPYTLHHTPYTLHPTPHTRHPSPYTLNPSPYTLHSGSRSACSSPPSQTTLRRGCAWVWTAKALQTLNPKPSTLNPKP
jgi:hypothetical protein